jgi:hypothetical protein
LPESFKPNAIRLLITLKVAVPSFILGAAAAQPTPDDRHVDFAVPRTAITERRAHVTNEAGLSPAVPVAPVAATAFPATASLTTASPVTVPRVPAPGGKASRVTPPPSPRIAPSNVSPFIDLDRERQILDRAVVALSQGYGDAALAALDEHVKTFPNSQFARERAELLAQARFGSRRLTRAVISTPSNRYPNDQVSGPQKQLLKTDINGASPGESKK